MGERVGSEIRDCLEVTYVMAVRVAINVLWLILCPLAAAQNHGIRGIVLDEQGNPIGAVRVYSIYHCCPAQFASAISDEHGRFELEHIGSVLHIERDGFEPQSVVTKGPDANLELRIRHETEKNRLPKCRTTGQGDKLLGRRVRFLVPERGVHVDRGEDVDYVNYGIRVKRKGASLVLWFGATAFNPEPDDDLLISSSEFSQKNIYGLDGNLLGMDSRGRNVAGTRRHTRGLGADATYSNASPEESAVFDGIIDSMCVPSPDEKRHY